MSKQTGLQCAWSEKTLLCRYFHHGLSLGPKPASEPFALLPSARSRTNPSGFAGAGALLEIGGPTSAWFNPQATTYCKFDSLMAASPLPPSVRAPRTESD